MARRRTEAKRTVIVKVENLDSSNNVYHYCKQFGEIRNAIAYSIKDERNLVLIEYEHEDGVKEAFKFCGFPNYSPPWINQYLELRKSALSEPSSKDAPLRYDSVEFPSAADVLDKAESLEKQISLLYEHTGVNEIATRLKFMGVMQAENIVNFFMSSIFPDAIIHPFGSTLNGFGQRGCDLDMVLHYNRTKTIPKSTSVLNFYNRCDKIEEELRARAGRQVKCMSALIDHYLEGISPAQAFSGARVPIVRYYDHNVPCSVDISVMNV